MKILKSNKILTEFLWNVLYEPVSKIEGVNSLKSIKGYWNNENELSCDLFLIVDFGVKIPDISWNVQTKARDVLKTIDNINLNSINIHIIGSKIKEVR